MTEKPRRKRLRRLALRFAVVAMVGCGSIELFFRFALFHDSDLARSVGGGLREPQRYAHRTSPEYWKLMYRLQSWHKNKPNGNYDEKVGWLNEHVTAGTYEHDGQATLGARRPVLLYGDSFGHCVTADRDCWQGLLARSELADELALLNYATGGYGFDQIYLSYVHSIPRYEELDPIVVFTVLVDDDLDRSILPFRGHPKPHFTVTTEGLRLDSDVVAPLPKDYIEDAGVGITSYAWRYLVFGTRILPEGLRRGLAGYEDCDREAQELTREIVEALADDIDERGLDAVFFVFHGRSYTRTDRKPDWREPFLLAELERHGFEFGLSRDPLVADMLETGRDESVYFFGEGGGKNHYTPIGNEVVFRGLLTQIARAHDGRVLELYEPPTNGARSPRDPVVRRLDLPGAVAEGVQVGEGGIVRFLRGDYPPFEAKEDMRRIEVAVGTDGPSSVTYRLDRPSTRFAAILKPLRVKVNRGMQGRMELVAYTDGDEVLRVPLTLDSDPVRVEVPLEGVERLVLEVNDGGDGSEGDLCYLASPTFRQ